MSLPNSACSTDAFRECVRIMSWTRLARKHSDFMLCSSSPLWSICIWLTHLFVCLFLATYIEWQTRLFNPD